MPSSQDPTASETITPDTFTLQAMEALPEAVKRYASGDKGAFASLVRKAVELAAGQATEAQIKDSLARKLGDGL